ncbi:MAG TPA: SDR family NAD(P)-dependent oxidoreductase, partial [Conexibacter sp.]|nr:SDR family NAD(P)-dependent oxidoreductase [Conexibacter sp.]
MSGQPAPLFDLAGRVAVVTGAARGLGRAIAVGLAQHGADVALADLDAEGIAQTAAQVQASGRRALAQPTDVTDEQAVELLFERAEEVLGSVDTLVNVAFTPVLARPQELALADWERALSVNLTGYFLCARAAGRRMIARGDGGAIVNLASIAGTSGLGRGNVAYSVSKGGVVQLTRELAVEWGRYGIRVNAIQPAQFRTEGFKARFENPELERDGLLERMVQAIPLGRIGEPPDIVGPVVFLASDAARMVTG